MKERIGFGKRFGALIIDLLLGPVGLIIATGVAWLIGGLLGGVLGGLTSGRGGAVIGGTLGATAGFTITAVTAVIGFTLYAFIEPLCVASPGKMILGIAIGNADGTRADLSRHLLRYAIKNIGFVCAILAAITAVEALAWIGGLLGLVVFIGCFFALGKSKQALHDMIAKTAVYPKESLTKQSVSAQWDDGSPIVPESSMSRKGMVFFTMAVLFFTAVVYVPRILTWAQKATATPTQSARDSQADSMRKLTVFDRAISYRNDHIACNSVELPVEANETVQSVILSLEAYNDDSQYLRAVALQVDDVGGYLSVDHIIAGQYRGNGTIGPKATKKWEFPLDRIPIAPEGRKRSMVNLTEKLKQPGNHKICSWVSTYKQFGPHSWITLGLRIAVKKQT